MLLLDTVKGAMWYYYMLVYRDVSTVINISGRFNLKRN